MSERTLKIGTRGSLLAVTQSTWVKERIQARHPQWRIELVRITTKGDKILDVPLAKVGGKGLFVKEIEDALLDGRIDLAVHSMKDVPTELPAGLHLAVIPEREDPRDALLSAAGDSIAALPRGCRVGTSSLRRKAQLAAARPDLQIEDLRGNLDTRICKLEEGRYDAIVLATAGLNRLGLRDKITAHLSPAEMLPAIGQGALGIEMRRADEELLEAIRFLHHQPTAACVAAERSFLFRLEGGCQVPIGAHAELDGGAVRLTGLIAAVDGSTILRETMEAAPGEEERLGRELAEILLARGGQAILEEVYGEGAA